MWIFQMCPFHPTAQETSRMLQLSPRKDDLCPYRDCFGIETTHDRITWYQLLAVGQFASDLEIRHRYEQRRALAEKNQRETRNPVWEVVLDELQQAFDCLTHPRRKTTYDAELARLSRQEPGADSEHPGTQHHETKTTPPAHRAEQHSNGQSESARARFEPLRQLGRGQHGTRVFEAFELTLGRAVAVKCLEKRARTDSRCRSFIAEARFLASISHPNVVEIHSVNDRNYWIVMELLGTSLNEALNASRNGSCSPDRVTDFLRQALSALQEIHERGVTHGHLSLNSYRGAESGSIKLADAPGCTKEGQFRAPDCSQICVAPELLSPETFGEPRQSVDLYMLGFVAVQLLAGDDILKWFPKVSSNDSATQEQWLRWHATPLESLPDLEAFVPGIPANLARVIEGLSQKQVADRFHSASEALELLTPEPAPVLQQTESSQNLTATDADSGVEHRGGGAPCLVEARSDGPGVPDLVTTLLDYTLLWDAFRKHRSVQIVSSVTVLLLIVVIFFGGEEQVAMAQNSAPVPEPPILAPESDKPERFDDDFRTTDLEPQPTVLVAGRGDVIDDLRPVPLIPPPKPQLPSAPDANRMATLQPPVARPFAVVGAPPSQTGPLQDILRQMQASRKSMQWQELLQTAREIAPEDPRPLFVYCARHEFSRRTQNELQEAIALSTPRYTQPFRKSVESRLRGPWDIADVADEVIADLIFFRESLPQVCDMPEMTYDWEWIGRVIGYIEARSDESQHCRRILEEHRPRLLSGLDTDSEACILRGRNSIRQNDGPIDAEYFFPLTPDIDIGLCIATLATEDASDDRTAPYSDDTIVARTRGSQSLGHRNDQK